MTAADVADPSSARAERADPSSPRAERADPPSPRAERVARWGRALLYIACFSLASMRPRVTVAGLPLLPTDLLAAAAGACWAAAALLDPRYRRWDRMVWALLLYLAAVAWSLVANAVPLGTLVGRTASVAYLLALPVVALGLLDDEARLRRACLAWLAGTAVAVVLLPVALVLAAIGAGQPPLPSLLGVVQHHYGSLPLGGLVRYKLLFNNPNMLGAWLTASLAIVLVAADRGWIGRRTAIALLAGVSMALVATFSAGIGGAALLLALWYWLKGRDRRPARARAVLAAGGACAVAFVAAQAFTFVGYPDPAFAIPLPGTGIALVPASRLQTWTGAWHTFLAHPLAGVGMGAPVAHVLFVEPNGSSHLLTDGHDVLLDLAAQCGVLGVAAIVAVVATMARRSIPFRIDDPARDTAAVLLGIGLLDVLVYQGIGGGFENARFTWMLAGLLLVAARLRREATTCRTVDA